MLVSIVVDISFKFATFNNWHENLQVYLEVNDEAVDIHMKLDEQGAAFFVEGYDADEADEMEGGGVPPELATSPLPESGFPLNFVKAAEKAAEEAAAEAAVESAKDDSSSSDADRKLTDDQTQMLPDATSTPGEKPSSSIKKSSTKRKRRKGT